MWDVCGHTYLSVYKYYRLVYVGTLAFNLPHKYNNIRWQLHLPQKFKAQHLPT